VSKTAPASSSEMIEYYRQVDNFVREQVDSMRTLPLSKAAGAEQVIRFLPRKESLDSLGYVPVDAGRLVNNFRKIVDLLAVTSKDNPLALALQRHEAALAAMPWTAPVSELENSLSRWAEREELDVASLQQMLQWALSPFRRLAAAHYADELRQQSTNEKFICPICGSSPDCALLDDKEFGRRYLHCLCCDWQWPYKRMGCGYCGNEDHSQLGYLMVEEHKGYKIYCCEQCKSYLKTFDQREVDGPLDQNLLLKHLQTLFLDLLAIEKGYLPLHS
jgi:formate dehydrogenase accessory protein FdhE